MTTLALVITRDAPPPWPLLPFPVDTVHLFLLDQGTRLVHHPFAGFPPGQRLYCAHSHQRLQPPGPVASRAFLPGGLANLGEMVRESQAILSHPNHHPAPPGEPGLKDLAILLADDTHRQEAIRLACGLAGCGHHLTLVTRHDFTRLATELPVVSEHLAALAALGAHCRPPPPPSGTPLLAI